MLCLFLRPETHDLNPAHLPEMPAYFFATLVGLKKEITIYLHNIIVLIVRSKDE